MINEIKIIFFEKAGNQVILIFISLKVYMMPFLLGIIIAYICGPAVSFANKRFNLSIELAAGLFIIFIYVIVFFLTINIVPSIYKNLIEIINKIMEFDPNKISKNFIERFEFLMIDEDIIEAINKFKQLIISKIPTYLNTTANALVSSTQSVISIAFSLVFAPIISFYFLSDLYFKKFDERSFYGSDLFNYINNLAKNFVQVQALMITIYFIYYFILISIIGLNNSLTLSVICGILCVIPYIGAFIGLISCILASTIQYGVDYNTLILIIGFITIAILDTALISPRVVGKKFGLHPLLTIFSILVSASLFGLIGVIFAIPFAIITKDIARKFFIQTD